MIKLRDQQNRERRKKELLEWALADYGLGTGPPGTAYTAGTVGDASFRSTLQGSQIDHPQDSLISARTKFSDNASFHATAGPVESQDPPVGRRLSSVYDQ